MTGKKYIGKIVNAWTLHNLCPENDVVWWDWNEDLIEPDESLTCDKYIEEE